MLVCTKNFVPHHRKIVVIRYNYKRFDNILNSEILLSLIRKIKYLTDQFQLCFHFALATLNSSDVVETVTFETETSLKLRDRGFIKNSETETSWKIRRATLEISKFVDFAEIFQKNVVTASQVDFFKFPAFFRPVFIVSYLQIE